MMGSKWMSPVCDRASRHQMVQFHAVLFVLSGDLTRHKTLCQRGSSVLSEPIWVSELLFPDSTAVFCA